MRAVIHLPGQNQVKSKVFHLFFAYALSFAVVGASYIAYSRILTPTEFGLYSIALAIASFAQLALDGGLKSILIKSSKDLTDEEQRTLVFLMIATAVLLLGAIASLTKPLNWYFPTTKDDYEFLAVFSAVYLASYPFIFLPTALLEREFKYERIAWIESISILLERGSPVVLLVSFDQGIYSFVWGAILGRAFRVVAVGLCHKPICHVPSVSQIKRVLHFLREGWWFQSGTASALVRDNLHVILVGPWFGKEWVGFYAWGLQLCMIASQVFVQISARVSLPFFARAKDFSARWESCLYQVRLLTMLTVPILVAILITVRSFDTVLLQGKWDIAIGLLPLLFFRMIPGLATTPTSTLVLVERGGRESAFSSIIWTSCEIAFGLLFLYWVGPEGLAWSFSFTAWIGISVLVRSFRKQSFVLVRSVIVAIISSSSFWIAVGALLFTIVFRLIFSVETGNHLTGWLVVALLVVTFAYWSEPELRLAIKGLS